MSGPESTEAASSCEICHHMLPGKELGQCFSSWLCTRITEDHLWPLLGDAGLATGQARRQQTGLRGLEASRQGARGRQRQGQGRRNPDSRLPTAQSPPPPHTPGGGLAPVSLAPSRRWQQPQNPGQDLGTGAKGPPRRMSCKHSETFC